MTDDIHTAAERLLADYIGQHLTRDTDALLSRCATQLSDTFGISLREALRAAEAAYVGSLCGIPRGYIDIDQSTANRLILRDYTSPGARHLITLPELFQLVAASKAAHATAG